MIPIFPLGVVLFPGMILPLQVFEERYRTLVADLLALPDPDAPRFGVVAIRQGREVGADQVGALYEVGTLAVVSRVAPQPDGRYGLLTVGTERFRLGELDRSRPYLQAEIEVFDESAIAQRTDEAADPHVPGVVGAFRAYVATLGAVRGDEISLPDLPTGATLLSWLVAASAVVDLPVRQRLLEIEGTAARLQEEIRLLRDETNMLKTMAAAPAPHLVRTPQHPN